MCIRDRSYEDGFEADSDEIVKFIQASHLQSGITLSGGEPFEQPLALMPIAQAAIELGLNAVSYTHLPKSTLYEGISR